MTNPTEKRAPVQGYPGGIPWAIHLEAYEVYCKRWGAQPALIDLEGRNCRGGFSTGELDDFIPGWRDRVAEFGLLKTKVAEQAARLDDYATEINRLRNVIQAACSGGLEHMIDRWEQLFPDAPTPTVATRAKTADLQGLRDVLLNSGPVVRDEDGYWCSLALPHCDENVDYAKLLAVFGLETAIVDAESQMDFDAHEAMCEAGGCNAWTPTPPEGDGWVMVSLHDTEDGAVAFYVRPAAPAKKPRPIGVEAVAVVRPGGEDGPTLHWLLEGGIHAAAEGGEAVLVIAGAPITDDDGHGYVYRA